MKTVTVFKVHCQTNDDKPDINEFVGSRECQRHVRDLVTSLRADGYHGVNCSRVRDADNDVRLMVNGDDTVRIWITEHTEYAEEIYADEIAENQLND